MKRVLLFLAAVLFSCCHTEDNSFKKGAVLSSFMMINFSVENSLGENLLSQSHANYIDRNDIIVKTRRQGQAEFEIYSQGATLAFNEQPNGFVVYPPPANMVEIKIILPNQSEFLITAKLGSGQIGSMIYNFYKEIKLNGELVFQSDINHYHQGGLYATIPLIVD